MSGTVSQDQIADLERRYGVNDPLPVKYWKWLSRTVRGDFGNSFETDLPVGPTIMQRLPITIALTFGTALFSWLISIPLGVYIATHRYSIPDYVITVSYTHLDVYKRQALYNGITLPQIFIYF